MAWASSTPTWMIDSCAVMAHRGPKCGRRFVGKNIWPACDNYPLEGFVDGKGTRARELFEGLESLIAACVR
jgi:hypothetical protein